MGGDAMGRLRVRSSALATRDGVNKRKLAITMLLCCTLATLAVACGTDAAMFRDNPEHTGEYAGPGPSQQPGLAWNLETGGSAPSDPTISGGVLYFGSHDGYLYALDAQSGAERWRFAAGSRVSSSPAVSGGMVYFGSDDGVFYAVDAREGTELWRFRAGDQVQAAPALSGGMVYFGSDDGYLYALDAQSGAERWRFDTGSYVLYSAAISAVVVYLGSLHGRLYALDARSGAERWRFETETGDAVRGSPAARRAVRSISAVRTAVCTRLTL